MLLLLLVSLIWAFSFGLIKNGLAGLDPAFVAAARLWIALLALLPAMLASPARLRGTNPRLLARLMLAGALQFGVMYLAYNAAFQYLKAYEVALFTVFTPIYVTLIHDSLARRFDPLHLGAACLAVLGTAITRLGYPLAAVTLTGFALVQLSNLSFAFGQVYYVRIMRAGGGSVGRGDAAVFALPTLGGALVASLAALPGLANGLPALNAAQGLALLYLGMVASGLGFLLWNTGARQVNTGMLAVFNNLKVPLAVAVSLLFFGESASLPRLLLGGALVLVGLALTQPAVRARIAPRLARHLASSET